MTPLKALAFVSVFALGMAAQPAFALNDDAAPGARNTPSGATLHQAQVSPKPQLTPEERKAKRKHRRMMKRQHQQDRPQGAPQPPPERL